MSTPFDLLRQRCGLSQAEAAAVLDVRLDTVKSWCSGRNPANARVLAELRVLYRRIVQAGDQLGALRHQPHWVEVGDDGVIKEVTLGAVESTAAAKRLGFPCVGAHEAALGLAIAALPDDVAVTLVPYKVGVETATAKA